jgi:hypothetical protein
VSWFLFFGVQWRGRENCGFGGWEDDGGSVNEGAGRIMAVLQRALRE